MLHKLVASLLLATSLTGCFTAAGAVVGSAVEARAPETQSAATETGAAIGMVLDVVAVGLLLSAGGQHDTGDSCFTYGPGEGGGRCGGY